MNDESGTDNGTDGGWAPGPPTPPSQPVEPALTLDTETEVRSGGGRGGRVLAGVLGVVALVAGAVFAVTQLGASGAGSPEEAVDALLAAASDEDVLGMLAALDPGERDALQGPVEDLVGELERLEVLDDSFELSGVAGIDYEFTDVTYRVEDVRGDLARVYFTGGTVSYAVDGEQIPIGAFVRDTVDRFGGSLELEFDESDAIADDGTFLVARDTGDGWRVSIGYTIAEHARLDAGLPLPTDGIEPVGADSPEAAVEGMLRSLAGFDLEGVLARLSPGEFGALQDYAPLFIAPAVDELRAAGEEFAIEIDDLELRSEGSGDRSTVYVDGFAVTVASDGISAAVEYGDGCLSIGGDMDELGLAGSPFEDGPVCIDDLEEIGAEMGFAGDVFGEDLGALEDLSLPIGTAKVDGGWYVAPIASLLDGMVGGLESLDRAALDDFVAMAEGFFFLGESFEEFEEVGEAIGESPEDFPYEEFPDEFPFEDPEALEDFLEDVESLDGTLEPAPTTTP